MSRRIETLKEKQHKLLIPFITAGYLAPDQTLNLMHGLVSNGADLIELGVPFSDPMADGKVIQAASEKALEKDTNLDDIIDLVSEFRKTDSKTPIIFMGYANPMEHYGWADFLSKAAKAGVDGLLTVDFPPEAVEPLEAMFNDNQMAHIYLVAPTTTEKRMVYIAKNATGFIYFVSLKGVTGANAIDYNTIATQVSFLRKETDLPVVAGFGIKDRQTATEVAQYTDGVVIGSKIIELIEASENHSDPTEALAWFKDIRNALDDMETSR